MADLNFEYPDARCITDGRGYVYWNAWKWVEYDANQSGEYIAEDSLVRTMINVCKNLFDGTFTYTETVVKEDGTTEEVTKNYPAIDSSLSLTDYFLENYGDKFFKFPACRVGYNEDNNSRVIQTAYVRAQNIMSNYAFANKYKVLTSLRTIDLKYNPIENYNMVESFEGGSGGGTGSEGHSWLGTVNHKTSGNITEESTANGTVTTKSTTYDNTDFRDVEKVETKIPTTKTSYGTGDNVYTVSDTQKKYNKDDPTNDESTGSVMQTSYQNADVHTLKRRGNIGVTTSQQMIQSERELAQFNIVKDFFDGFQKTITLDIWY